VVAAPLVALHVTNGAAAGLTGMSSQAKGSVMQSRCTAYTNDADARAEVDRLLADGIPAERISVLVGHMAADHRDEHVGAFAGQAGAVGGFAGDAHSSGEAMGSFASGAERRGGFGDADRDEVVTHAGGVRRVHIASHRELEQRLAEAGLDGEAVQAEVAALHHGRALVLVRAD
jgi:hypothetical protein